MESKNYHELHSRLYDGMSRFFSSKNVVIMICRSGRHRSAANAELRSNTLTRFGRHQHSASLLHLSELDFWKNTCAGKCSACSKQSTGIFQTHYDRVRAECSRPASVSDSVTEHWKRPRLENYSESCAGNKSLKARFTENTMDEEEHFLQASEKRATSARTMSDEPNTNRGILDELAERLGNFHESARALADCLQTRSVTRKTHQSMIDVLVPRQRVKNLVLVPRRWLRNHVLVPRQRVKNLVLVPRRWLRNHVLAPRQ